LSIATLKADWQCHRWTQIRQQQQAHLFCHNSKVGVHRLLLLSRLQIIKDELEPEALLLLREFFLLLDQWDQQQQHP